MILLNRIFRRKLFSIYFLIISIFLAPLNQVSAAFTWSTQTSGIVTDLRGVYFVDSNTGWAVGNSGAILKTVNGGSTWSAQTSGTANTLRGVYFVDSNTGWVVGDSGTILATTNGGSTWSAQTSGTANQIYGVSFADANTGWAVGAGGIIRATVNGGSTWSAQTSGTTMQLSAVSFVDATTGWAAGGSFGGGTIRVTTNGGSTWSAQTYSCACGSHNFNGVYFTDANTGWAVGGAGSPTSGIIFATTNGGTTWTQQTSGTTNTIQGVYFTDANTGWAVGNSGTILATTNGGSTWSAQTSGTSAHLLGTSFVDASTGWAVGSGGAILSGASPASVISTRTDPPRKNPYPTIYGIYPESVSADSDSVELTLIGADFLGSSLISDTIVYFNGNELAVKPMNVVKMTAIIPAEYLKEPGKYEIYASNPGPGGGSSNVIRFIVVEKPKSSADFTSGPESIQESEKNAEPAGEFQSPDQNQPKTEGSVLFRLMTELRNLINELIGRNVHVPAQVRLVANDYRGIFTKNFIVGSIDEEVRLLQKFLNNNGYLISTSGPGSSGLETNYFGIRTQEALARFQRDKNIQPAAGLFGPKTRSVIESMSAD